MGNTTFSGPIKAGTIKNTTGTTLGSDVANVGQVVMAQTFSADLSGRCRCATGHTTQRINPAQTINRYINSSGQPNSRASICRLNISNRGGFNKNIPNSVASSRRERPMPRTVGFSL